LVVKIIGPYPTSAVGVLLALAVGGCADNNPPTGKEVGESMKGTDLPNRLGHVTKSYCRHNYSHGYTCVVRTATSRFTCTVKVDADEHPEAKACAKIGG
jgi:hypothetical protein